MDCAEYDEEDDDNFFHTLFENAGKVLMHYDNTTTAIMDKWVGSEEDDLITHEDAESLFTSVVDDTQNMFDHFGVDVDFDKLENIFEDFFK